MFIGWLSCGQRDWH